MFGKTAVSQAAAPPQWEKVRFARDKTRSRPTGLTALKVPGLKMLVISSSKKEKYEKVSENFFLAVKMRENLCFLKKTNYHDKSPVSDVKISKST